MDIVKLVMKQGLVLTLLGLTIGAVAALMLMRLLSALLFEVSATDPLIFGFAIAALGLVALVACLVPARRATKVNPIIALRCE